MQKQCLNFGNIASKKRRQSMIKGAAGKGFNPPVVLRMPVSQICVCLSHRSSHQRSHNATGQRTHQRLKGDPTMSRQLFRWGLPHLPILLLVPRPTLRPITLLPRPQVVRLKCSSPSVDEHHRPADRQTKCCIMLFALLSMFLTLCWMFYVFALQLPICPACCSSVL